MWEHTLGCRLRLLGYHGRVPQHLATNKLWIFVLIYNGNIPVNWWILLHFYSIQNVWQKRLELFEHLHFQVNYFIKLKSKTLISNNCKIKILLGGCYYNLVWNPWAFICHGRFRTSSWRWSSIPISYSLNFHLLDLIQIEPQKRRNKRVLTTVIQLFFLFINGGISSEP